MNETPYEWRECQTFVEWCHYSGIKYCHLGQETFTRSWKQKSKNKMMGVTRGFPDYCVVIPAEKLDIASPRTIFIEMKRKKGGRTSKEQKEWIQALNDSGIDTYVCKGADEAIKTVESYFKK
jgi:hypothetical protein